MPTILKTPMFTRLENEYYISFSKARKDGWQGEIAFNKASQVFLDKVISILISEPEKTSEVGCAYDMLKKDQKLNHRADIFYTLQFCDDQTRQKFLPMLQ